MTQVNIHIAETGDESEADHEVLAVPQPDPAKRGHFEFSIPEGARVVGWGKWAQE